MSAAMPNITSPPTDDTTLYYTPELSPSVVSASQTSVGVSTASVASNTASYNTNSSISSSTTSSGLLNGTDASDEGLSDGGVAVVIILVIAGICAIAAVLIYLKTTGAMYRILTCKVTVTKRRSSTTSSRRPLDVDDHEDEGHREDDLPVTREATMFTIDDFEPVQNDEFSRAGNAEEYFYDEVFGQSMFEDEATNTSMRRLYMVNEEEDDFDMFDVDVIVNSDTAPTTTTTNPTTTTTTTTTGAIKT